MVVLSGTTKTQESADRAATIARDTEGVTSVTNHITLKKDD
jgi:osmotically-inducible protein OsmY